MKDHLIKDFQLVSCLYCNHEFVQGAWKSEFEVERHYKSIACVKCGRKNTVNVDFHGSGHDSWTTHIDKADDISHFEHVVEHEHKKTHK